MPVALCLKLVGGTTAAGDVGASDLAESHRRGARWAAAAGVAKSAARNIASTFGSSLSRTSAV
jgi:hypothetical protein